MSDVEVIGFRTRMSAAEQSFVAAMRRLYEEGRDTDVTLVCGNVRLQVHSAVLIARFMKHDTLLLINFLGPSSLKQRLRGGLTRKERLCSKTATQRLLVWWSTSCMALI